MQNRFETHGPANSMFATGAAGFSQNAAMARPAATVLPNPISGAMGPATLARHGHSEPRRSAYLTWGKRVLDTVLVVLSMPVTVPLVLFFALLLWFEGGKPFYLQTRIGRNGKHFSMLKLRSMVQNADARLNDVLENDPELRAEWETTQKLRHDPRVTRLGALLRQTSLDELPQLWNVLRGEMSLVGPRPMMPEQLSLYGEPTDYYALLPGLTGIWQVSTRNESSFAHRAIIDADYRKTASLSADVKLLIKTVGVVLRRTGC